MGKENRGGKRVGAGRPPTGNARIKTSITLKSGDKTWMQSQNESMSELIDKAIDLLRNTKT